MSKIATQLHAWFTQYIPSVHIDITSICASIGFPVNRFQFPLKCRQRICFDCFKRKNQRNRLYFKLIYFEFEMINSDYAPNSKQKKNIKQNKIQSTLSYHLTCHANPINPMQAKSKAIK